MSSRSHPETLSPGEQHGQPNRILPSSCLHLLPVVCITVVGRSGLQKHHPGTSVLQRALPARGHGQSSSSSLPSKSCENESDALNSSGHGRQSQQIWQRGCQISHRFCCKVFSAPTQQRCPSCSPSSQCIHDLWRYLQDQGCCSVTARPRWDRAQQGQRLSPGGCPELETSLASPTLGRVRWGCSAKLFFR